MRKYTYKTSEKRTFWENGTVYVIAKNKKEAEKLIHEGKGEYEGDHQVDYDTGGELLDIELQFISSEKTKL